jgi:hypothetical protein
MSRSGLLRTKNISDKCCRETRNTFYVQYFFFENHVISEIMWKNIVKWGRPQMRIWRIRFAYWVTKATDAHSEYVIIIVFPQQQWLHERALIFPYTYIACLNLSVNTVYKSETCELYLPL